MPKDSGLIQESGRKRKIAGTAIIGVGVLFLVYGIAIGLVAIFSSVRVVVEPWLNCRCLWYPLTRWEAG